VINADELAICKRRGHTTPGRLMDHGWMQCEACGMWLRDRVVREEREDDPPEEELDKLVIAGRLLREAANRDANRAAKDGAGKG
jgi:hypothetical protein